MATLVSPGVSISVSDESFYASAGAGTVPLIIVATAQDKSSPDGSGTAAFTSKANAGKLQLITSQRELLQQFGNPLFYKSGSNQLHGYDLNEYGLLAAHSFLGLANRAYVLRADVDLGQLSASSSAPSGAIADGSYWLDTANPVYGLREYSGTAWVKKDVSCRRNQHHSSTGGSKRAFGLNGDFVLLQTQVQVEQPQMLSITKNPVMTGILLVAQVGTLQQAVTSQWASLQQYPLKSDGVSPISPRRFIRQTSTPNQGADYKVKLYSSPTKAFSTVSAPFYANTDAAYAAIGTANVSVGNLVGLFDNVDPEEGTVVLKRHNGNSTVVATGSAISNLDVSGNSSFDIVYGGTTVVVTLAGTISGTPATSTAEDAVFDINAALAGAPITKVTASLGSDNNVALTSSDGRDIVLQSNHADFGPSSVGFGSQAVTAGITYSNFADLSYEASKTSITGTLAEGTFWYNATVAKANIDILENDASSGWQTLTKDLNVAASAPTTQSDGTALVAGDIWLDSDDTENFPCLFKWSGTAWVKIDGTDQVTSEGIIYADFRQSKTSSLDADAPAQTAYPAGMLGFNKRASAGNVKEYKINYTPASTNIGNVWVDASGNQTDGKMYGLRKAVHNLVKIKMQALLFLMMTLEQKLIHLT